MSDWRVPGFTEVDVLGVGGFGRVVLAKHQESGRMVAIKYLLAEYLADPDIAAGFRREAWLLSGVRSPHVVQLFDFVETPQGAALVMEAVPGVSLRALLAAENVLAPESALAILKGSLLGLADAHAAGVVHRDYKPGNVLVSREGQSKLVDFGLATLDGRNGLTAGSPSYMAPEQWAGQPGQARHRCVRRHLRVLPMHHRAPAVRGDHHRRTALAAPDGARAAGRGARETPSADRARDGQRPGVATVHSGRLRVRVGNRRPQGLRKGLGETRLEAPGRRVRGADRAHPAGAAGLRRNRRRADRRGQPAPSRPGLLLPRAPGPGRPR